VYYCITVLLYFLMSLLIGNISIIIIIIGTTALFEPRPSSEASASRPYSLQHSSSFSPTNFLAPSITPSSHLTFGLPLCPFPSTTATRILRVALCSCSRITCPAHLSRLTLKYVTMSLSLYSVYSLSLYFILHSPFSTVQK
jgi:hypothetical protein